MSRPSSWRDLTDDECIVAIEAYESSPLAVVLNSLVPGPDAPYWNRKHRYVSTAIEATRRLRDARIVSVWEEPRDGVGEGGLLFPEDARRVISDPRNWWLYDTDDVDDPDLSDAQRATSSEWSSDHLYELVEGPHMAHLGDVEQDQRIPSLVALNMLARWRRRP